MTMSRLPTPASKSVPLRKSGPRSHPLPQLKVAMRCDTAFRIVARRHFASLGTNREATCEGDPIALHQMRAALTHLRTSILFFSPMVDDAITERIRDELKWLNSELGAVRDLDVAIERIAAANPELSQALPHLQSWQEKRAEGHRQLTHSLRSARYRRLVERTSGWIEKAPGAPRPPSRPREDVPPRSPPMPQINWHNGRKNFSKNAASCAAWVRRKGIGCVF
jgi:CHAD domain-containing protein